MSLSELHHTTASKIEDAAICDLSYFRRHVQKRKGSTSTPATAGRLKHAALAEAIEARARGDRPLSDPVTGEELLAALEAQEASEPIDPAALALAREGLLVAATRLDFRFVGKDEHGPLLERDFTVPVGEGIVVGGRVDRVDVLPEERIVSVVEYKTGRRVKTRAELLADPQVGLYAAWARSRWPGWAVWVELHYVTVEELARPVEIPWSPELEEVAKASARALVKRTRAERENEKAWPASVGPWCAWCEHQETCAAYKAKLAEPLDGAAPGAVEELVPEIKRVRTIARLAVARDKALSARAKPLLEQMVDAKGLGSVAGFPVRLRTVPGGIVREHVKRESTRLEIGAEADEEEDGKLLDARQREEPPRIAVASPVACDASSQATGSPSIKGAEPASALPAVAAPAGAAGLPSYTAASPAAPASISPEPARGQGAGAAVTQAARPASAAAPAPVDTDREFAEGCQRTVDRGGTSAIYAAMCSAAHAAVDARQKHGRGSPEHVAARELVEARKAEWLACAAEAPLVVAPPACRACGKPAGGDPRGLCFACSQLSLPAARPLLGGAALAVHGAARDSAKTPPNGCQRVDLGSAGVAIVCTRGARPRCKAPNKAGGSGKCSTCGIRHKGSTFASCEKCGASRADGAYLIRNGVKPDGSPAPLLCGLCVSKPTSAPAGASS